MKAAPPLSASPNGFEISIVIWKKVYQVLSQQRDSFGLFTARSGRFDTFTTCSLGDLNVTQ